MFLVLMQCNILGWVDSGDSPSLTSRGREIGWKGWRVGLEGEEGGSYDQDVKWIISKNFKKKKIEAGTILERRSLCQCSSSEDSINFKVCPHYGKGINVGHCWPLCSKHSVKFSRLFELSLQLSLGKGYNLHSVDESWGWREESVFEASIVLANDLIWFPESL